MYSRNLVECTPHSCTEGQGDGACIFLCPPTPDPWALRQTGLQMSYLMVIHPCWLGWRNEYFLDQTHPPRSKFIIKIWETREGSRPLPHSALLSFPFVWVSGTSSLVHCLLLWALGVFSLLNWTQSCAHITFLGNPIDS